MRQDDDQQLADHSPEDLSSLWNHFKVVSADKTKVECLIKQCGLLSFSSPGFSPSMLLLHLQTKHKQFYETTLKKKLLKRSNKRSNGVNLSCEKWIDRDIFSINFSFDKSKLNLDRLKTISVSFNGYRLHVPVFLVDAFDLLCLGAKTEGLFQSRGNRQRVKYMRYVFFGEFGIPEYCTLYDVCDLITYFFRHLNEPIFSAELEKQFLELRRNSSSIVLNNIKMCLNELTPSKRDTVIYLAVKLKYIVSFGNVNKATTHKIAQYFAKSLFRTEKDSVLFKKSAVAPPEYAVVPIASYTPAVQKQPQALITVSLTPSDEEIDVKPIIIPDKKKPKKKQIVTIDDDVDENDPNTLQLENLESNLSSTDGLECFPPYVSMTSSEVVNNDANHCTITVDHLDGNLVKSAQLEVGRNGEQTPTQEDLSSCSDILACPYCSESFKSALLQSYHVRQKHSKQFLGKKTRFRIDRCFTTDACLVISRLRLGTCKGRGDLPKPLKLWLEVFVLNSKPHILFQVGKTTDHFNSRKLLLKRLYC
uniref:Rho-GAP domain-containing protein n=1 Tax=Romanomermis culicivorax TaxID=13658 RepID=A0A915I085_ROMCU